MRWTVSLCVLFFCSGVARGQEQERSLIDRLLRPDMELHNRAQDKAFIADSKLVSHQQTAETFVTGPATKQKTFNDAHPATTKEYASGSSRADLRSRSLVQVRNIDAHSPIMGSSARDVRPAYDAGLAVSGRNFVEDDRTFREQGKSQKSLNRQNPPLTIDQVRELLNKNK